MSKILCFCWNADQQTLCEKYYEKDLSKVEKSFFRFTKRQDCYNPFFFEHIKSEIVEQNPNIVTIVTEEEPDEETYFHSDFLPEEMGKLQYKLLIRDKTLTYYNALRISIYIKTNENNIRNIDLLPESTSGRNKNVFRCIPNEPSPEALCLYVEANSKKIAFIAITILPDYYGWHNDTPICFDKIEEKFIENKGLNYAFMLGDFSETSASDHEVKDTIPKNYKQCDIKSRPNFGYTKPIKSDSNVWTSVLDDNNKFNTYYNQQDVSKLRYHDRIFHRVINGEELGCINYETIYGPPMLKDYTHLGALGVYIIPSSGTTQPQMQPQQLQVPSQTEAEIRTQGVNQAQAQLRGQVPPVISILK